MSEKSAAWYCQQWRKVPSDAIETQGTCSSHVSPLLLGCLRAIDLATVSDASVWGCEI